MFLIKDFASQQALAGAEQQFGYGRVNPSVGVGALGPAGGNAVGDFAGSATLMSPSAPAIPVISVAAGSIRAQPALFRSNRWIRSI